MLKKLTRKRTVILGLVGALCISGAALAYWTTSGSGSGSATTGSAQGVNVTQTSTVSGLVPGGAAKAIDFTITNPSSTPQYISKVAVSIASVKDGNGNPATGCSAADFALVQPTDVNRDLPAGDTAFAPSGATIKMVDADTNQDGCKGVTVNLAFNAS